MQSIHVKYLSPTASAGARLKATASSSAGSVTVSYHSYSSTEEGYKDAAEKLKKKLGWTGKMYGGETKDGMVFVFPDDRLMVNPVPPLKSKTRKNPIVKHFSNTDYNANSFITKQYKGEYIQQYSVGRKTIAKVMLDNGLKFEGELAGAKKFINEHATKSNPKPRTRNAPKVARAKTTKVVKTRTFETFEKRFIVYESRDGKVWLKLADFYYEKHAKKYAQLHANAYPAVFVKVETE